PRPRPSPSHPPTTTTTATAATPAPRRSTTTCSRTWGATRSLTTPRSPASAWADLSASCAASRDPWCAGTGPPAGWNGTHAPSLLRVPRPAPAPYHRGVYCQGGRGASVGGWMVGYTQSREQLQTRLRRIEGQVRGLQRMVGEDAYCIDVLTQVSAGNAGLRSVGGAALGGTR